MILLEKATDLVDDNGDDSAKIAVAEEELERRCAISDGAVKSLLGVRG